MAPTLPGSSGRPAATRRSLLSMGAKGLLAGGAAVAISDVTSAVTGATPAAAAATNTATPDWINVASSAYGADPTGATDSTTAFSNAIAAAASAGGGVVYIPAGTYLISSTLTCTTVPVYFVGDGTWATIIEFSGTGDCFRVYDSTTYGNRTKWGGGFVGITISGAKAGAGSTGLHVGDLLQYELDLSVQDFYGTGSIGVHLDNNYYWTEQPYGRIYAQNCTSHVVFDWTSATSTTSSGSFERCDLDIYLDAGVNDGVVFQNGAYVSNGSLKIRGNFGYSSSPVSTAVLRLTGSGDANGYSGDSGITNSMLDIGVECGTLTGYPYTPQTIIFGTAPYNKITNCYGALNFGAAGDTFAESNNNGNIYSFIGLTSGDATLPGQWVTYTSGFPTGVTGQISFRALPNGNDVMVAWNLTVASGTTLTKGQAIRSVDPRFVYDSDNKIIPGNNAGGGLSGDVYAPAYVNAAKGTFQYNGPTYDSSGTSWWYGQGVYSLDLG